MDLKKFIRDIPDFPKEGILYRDITPLLAEPQAFNEALNKIVEVLEIYNPDALVAIESRGFIFASPAALALNLPLIPVRKPGKLPHKTHTVEYNLEYGNGKLDIHQDALKKNSRVAIIDDLLATGGTAKGASDLVTLSGAEVCTYCFLIELGALGGRKILANAPVESVISY